MGKTRQGDDPLAEILPLQVVLRVLNMSRQYFYTELKAKRIRTIKRGQLRMVTRTEIGKYIKLCEDETHDADGKPIMDPRRKKGHDD
jgi:hypothetical protein